MTPPLQQISSEFDALLDLFRERLPWRILEVGVARGGTLHSWITNARPGALVVGVDLFNHGVPPATFAELRNDITFRAIKGDSTQAEIIEQARGLSPFDWVFIDGSHELVDVTRDWTSYGGMVERGIVAFHDITPHTRPGYYSGNVPALWQTIKQAFPTCEFVAEPGEGWGGIGVVFIG
jgi:hypothetical protein